MSDNHEKISALIRASFLSFLLKAFEEVHPGKILDTNWHIQLLCWLMTRCDEGELKRLLICLCPRSLKSFIISVAWPAWCLGQDPTKKIICISYSDDLAAKLSRDFQRIVISTWYKKAFPATVFGKSKFTTHEATTSENGFRFATSVGGTLTGRGGDIIIIDDPIKAEDATSETIRNSVNHWFASTVSSRFDNPDEGILVIVSQRTHMDDLAGFLKERSDWHEVSIPAIAFESERIQIGNGPDDFINREPGDLMHPDRLSKEFLDQQKSLLGSYNFAAQYQQDPIPLEGNLVRQEWLRYHEYPHNWDGFEYIVQSWDCAVSTNDGSSYSVCLTFGLVEQRAYLLHVLRERLDFPLLLKKAKSHARVYGADLLLIENASSGRQLYEILGHERDIPVKAIDVDTDKEARLAAVSHLIEQGRIYLPTGAPWLNEFMKEILSFPNSKYNDQVDSFSQFLRWFMEKDRNTIPELTVRILGKNKNRDRYYERNGIHTFPSGW